MAASLHISGIRKTFGKGDKTVEVLKRIDIDVAPGEFLILVGPSGCGKSTLLNIIAGLDEPTEGEIRIAGRNVVGVAPAARDIAMVFQSYALYPTMSVADNIGFALEMRKVPKAERRQRIGQVAAMLQIEHLLDRRPCAAVGRAAPARGHGPGAGPPAAAVFVRRAFEQPGRQAARRDARRIKRLHQLSGITSVYVTHDQIEAMTLGDKVAVMKDGIIQQFGTPKDIYNNPANLFVASFIGSPPMNFIPLRLQRKEGRLLALLDSGRALRIAAGHAGRRARRSRSDPWHAPGADRAGGQRGEWFADHSRKVQVTEPTGPDTLVFVNLNDTKVCCRLAPDVAPAVGETLTLQFDPSKVLLFDAKTGERLGVAGQPQAETRAAKVTQLKGR